MLLIQVLASLLGQVVWEALSVWNVLAIHWNKGVATHPASGRFIVWSPGRLRLTALFAVQIIWEWWLLARAPTMWLCTRSLLSSIYANPACTESAVKSLLEPCRRESDQTWFWSPHILLHDPPSLWKKACLNADQWSPCQDQVGLRMAQSKFFWVEEQKSWLMPRVKTWESSAKTYAWRVGLSTSTCRCIWPPTE